MRLVVVRLADLSGSAGLNPYTGLLYGQLTRDGFELAHDPRFELRWLWRERHRVRVLHFHYALHRHYVVRGPDRRPRPLLSWARLPAFVARLGAARILGYRLAWTIHEVYPPQARPGERLHRTAARALARSCHLLLAHEDAVATGARSELGRAAEGIHVVPHGSYSGVYPGGRPAAAVRAQLGIAADAFVFLSFGSLRRDKDVELLLEAFRGLEEPAAVLLFAGRLEDARAVDAVAAAAREDPRIRPPAGVVPLEEVAELFGAADAVVLARSVPWTSGSVILALTLGVPVVAAEMAPYRELLGGEAAGWLFAPGDAASLRTTLARAAADRQAARAKGAAARTRAAALPGWPEIAARTATLLRELL